MSQQVPCDVDAEEAKSFLKALRGHLETYDGIKVHFHNDVDGLNSALLLKDVLERLRGRKPLAFLPLDHSEMFSVKLADGLLHVFLDIRRPEWEKENVVVIDHHLPHTNTKLLNERHFIVSPPREKGEGESDKGIATYPSCTALLSSYLFHIAEGGRKSMIEFALSDPFKDDRYRRVLLHLAALSDNLWQLSEKKSLLRRWVGGSERERALLLLSVSASLLLGEKEKKLEVVGELFSNPGDVKRYVGVTSEKALEAWRLSRVAEEITVKAVRFVGLVLSEANRTLPLLYKNLENVRRRLNELLRTKPIRLKDLPVEDWERSRERWEDLRANLRERQDVGTSEEERERLRYYVEEIINLKRQEENLKESIDAYERRKSAAIDGLLKGNLPPLLVYLPRQSSDQVKGILASLLYFHGWRNIVMEERGEKGLWGARGFRKEELEELLSTVTLDEASLKRYLGEEEILRRIKKELGTTYSLEKSVKYSFRYSGGIGGRGLTYGGEVQGMVPFLFALLEGAVPDGINEKIKELIKKRQFGLALKGFTEGESTVPAIRALKDKLKRRGFILAQPHGFPSSADLLSGQLSHLFLYFLGEGRSVEFSLGEEGVPDFYSVL